MMSSDSSNPVPVVVVNSNTAPTVANLLVCDGAHRDPGSGKWTLLGLFNSINSKGFPITHPQMICYVAVTNVKGKMPLRLQIVASDRKDEVFYKVEAELTVNDPKGVAELVIPIQRVTFVRPAEYLLQVYGNNQFLGERSIIVAAA
jgi:hypothetical protein